MTLRRSQLVLVTIVAVCAVTALGIESAAGTGGQQEEDSTIPVLTATADGLARQAFAILRENCFECHGLDDVLGGLDLRSETTLQAGGDHGNVVVAHDADASLLYQAVARTSRPYMPYGRAPLPDEQVEIIRQWIVSGGSLAAVRLAMPHTSAAELAALEERPITEEERAYWAFVKPVRPAVPEGNRRSRSDNPIDAFLLDATHAKGLTRAPPADNRSLVRRVYLDVLGLPPSPEEIDEFLNDGSPDAWERLVDKLLASPHYGERWARHWMDLARYADSGGYEFDLDWPQMYRYRDYLVESFNSDKPYDQFVREQLAGDEIAPGSDEAIATGFLRVGLEGTDVELNRLDEVDDLIRATSLTFMGLTVGCARCHNHKFDPIPQKDYYRMQAVFWPTVKAEFPLVPADEWETNRAERERIEAMIEPLSEAKKATEKPYHDMLVVQHVANLPEHMQIAWHTAEEERTEAQKLNVVQIEAALSVGDVTELITQEHLIELMPAEVKAVHAIVAAAIKDLEEKQPERLAAARVIGEEGREPEPSYFLHRGSPGAKGTVMSPGVLTVASNGEWDFARPPEEATSSWRRRGFADWLVNEDNPLTVRVMVNRLWQHHFGEGIVRTPSNFGKMGMPPTHPELLDWLAVEFMERGWSMKAMHRLMLNSQAYRMAAADVPGNAEIDPENLLLWRMPRVRLDAETIRDSILATAGTLDRTMGGPGVFPYIDPDLFEVTSEREWRGLPDSDPATWRRSLYVFSKRTIRYPMFETFDQPNMIDSIDRRQRTTVALQALILMNNEMVLLQSDKFAERVRREAGNDIGAQIDRAIQLALGRPATALERDQAMELVSTSTKGLAELCHLLFNLNEFVYLP